MIIPQKNHIFAQVFLISTLVTHAFTPNYDETKVGSYSLPDPLVRPDGSRVTTPETWLDQQRPEILESYRETIFGHSPATGTNVTFNVWETAANALGGTATRKQIEINFSGTAEGPFAHLLLYTPTGRTNCAVFLCLQFSGNYTVIDDPAVGIFPEWSGKTGQPALPKNPLRGKAAQSWNIPATLARGYGIAMIDYREIEPDLPGDAGIKYGVRKNFPAPKTNDWGAIAAWAWGASRALDFLSTDPDVDAKRVILHGHSRLGKTVLWAGAQDTRFAAIIASCSGEMGAALSRRDYGETVDVVCERFSYWMSNSFLQYQNQWNRLPVDSHYLISLIAPRPLFLSTGSDDQWADPRGEFLAAKAAAPVYALFGKSSLTEAEFPPLDQPLRHGVWFNCHTGKHEVQSKDWDYYRDFADSIFNW